MSILCVLQRGRLENFSCNIFKCNAVGDLCHEPWIVVWEKVYI